MPKFFKGTEKKPFNYPAIIETRYNPTNWILWGILTVAIVTIVAIIAFNVLNKPFNEQTQTTPSISISSIPTEQEISYTAAFAIYTNGTFRVFTASMYHNLSEDVFIQADNPNTIRVKKTGITWDAFFKTLPFKLTKECLITGTKQTFCTNQGKTLKFYLNGVKTEDLLDKEIKEGDKALITYGNESENEIKTQLNKL